MAKQTSMKVRRRKDGWWIVGVPDLPLGGVPRCTDCGPYDTKAEAVDGKQGLERFFKENPVDKK